VEFGVDFVLGEAGANQPVAGAAGTLWVHPNHGFCGMFDIGPWAGDISECNQNMLGSSAH